MSRKSGRKSLVNRKSLNFIARGSYTLVTLVLKGTGEYVKDLEPFVITTLLVIVQSAMLMVYANEESCSFK